jgi:hypothetical protein
MIDHRNRVSELYGAQSETQERLGRRGKGTDGLEGIAAVFLRPEKHKTGLLSQCAMNADKLLTALE